MNFLFKIVDFFYQKKKYSFLKKKIFNKISIFIDVGAHHGDTINEFLKIFSIEKIYAFEPSKKNFIKLKEKVSKIEVKNNVKIKIFPFGIGKKEEILQLNEITDGVSNTFNDLNIDSIYLKKKKFITTFFGIKKFVKDKVPTKIICLKDFIIQEKINKTLEEASKLLKKDKEKIVNELSKLLKVADGDQKTLKNTINKIEKKLKT